ncbi:Ku protein [Mesorhizobium sp. LHD-90]|uniref:non-homologous end joining protein Ku n=1 Tax=Mesorhizobium sp. LHD-90 TaxID=3071414 RepID=UPI0027E1699A|nr:Ku protein [Mesorhizobium sp. LHD-90]MDQ6436728.1 Ku protein [Mesorhizobium sp. LHD-90]
MAAPRAVWKGFLKFGSVACAVKLVGATSEAEKIHFRILSRKTREPVKSAYLDEGTDKVVETEDQVKGYELDNGEFLLLEPDEIKALKQSSEHTLEVDKFVDLTAIDQRYLDKPYHVVPADPAAREPFAVICEALARKKAAARSCIVLYQRGREVLIQPEGEALLMTTLRNHNQMVAAGSVFDGLKKVKTDAEMIEIAELLIDKKKTKFDPSKFEDSYENALIEMIKAKQQGKAPPKPAPKPKENVVNLADVLRKSLEKEGISRGKGAAKKGKKAA